MPKARPGSITTGRAPGGGACHGGPTQSGPISTGWWKERQRSAQSSATSRMAASGKAASTRSAAGAVRGELDPVAAGLDLLEPLRRELEEAGAKELGVTGGGGDGGADQWKTLFSFSKKPAIVAVGLGVAQRLELREQPALLGGEPARDGDVDEDAMVAAAEALQDRHALAAQHPHLARLRPGGEVELLGPVERLDRDLRAEGGLDDRQVDLREDVVALTDEPLVGADADTDVGVAGTAAERARVPLARHPDPVAVVDAGRDLDLELARDERPAGSVALAAELLDPPAAAAAVGAGRLADELAEEPA